jgi:hypothetical protein
MEAESHLDQPVLLSWQLALHMRFERGIPDAIVLPNLSHAEFRL